MFTNKDKVVAILKYWKRLMSQNGPMHDKNSAAYTAELFFVHVIVFVTTHAKVYL